MAQTVIFKKGTSFAFTATYTQDNPSVPADLTGVGIRVALVDAGYNYYPLAVTTTSPTTFTVTYPGDTQNWVTGPAYFDIRMAYGAGSVFYTETVSVDILASITGSQNPANPSWV